MNDRARVGSSAGALGTLEQASATAGPPKTSAQVWNSQAYATNGRFVATLASEVFDLLNPRPGERILDVGCGDGTLTAQLQAAGAEVLGVDPSPAMAAAARARGLEIDERSVVAMRYEAEFDAIFSNAALHWIPLAQQPIALGCIFRALKPGGRFVAEMGGQGNIAAIRAALSAVLGAHELDAEALAASFFPSPEHYAELLTAAGFRVQTISLHPRPTPLPGGIRGMALWVNTFRNGVLDHLAPETREDVVADTVALLKPILFSSKQQEPGGWTADYVRLRFEAYKSA